MLLSFLVLLVSLLNFRGALDLLVTDNKFQCRWFSKSCRLLLLPLGRPHEPNFMSKEHCTKLGLPCMGYTQ